MISSAYWIESSTALVMLSDNWHEQEMPPLELASEHCTISRLKRAPVEMFGSLSGYYQKDGQVHFIVFREGQDHLDLNRRKVFVAGDFNGWGDAINDERWRLTASEHEGQECYRLTLPEEEVMHQGVSRFKFVTGDEHWLVVNALAPNAVVEENDIVNYQLLPHQSGLHCFLFDVADRYAISGEHQLRWDGEGGGEYPILPGLFFYNLSTDLPLGASIEGSKTVFRLFAPRATKVSVEIFSSNRKNAKSRLIDMRRADETTWEVVVRENLHGQYYYFRVDGLKNKSSHFEREMRILDPYALATVTEKGPGIIWDRAKLPPKPEKPFEPPHWQDLIVMEAHVRDLARHAPIDATSEERQGFTGLAKWVRTEGNYIEEMGVNCVELQPIQQFDSLTKDEYHWGYMTTNYFSPCAWYGLEPEKGSQIEEFRDLVDAFHEKDIAVVLDVVYNHVGVPPYLLYIDKEYYLDIDKEGNLVNWSGCGNTTRASAAMMTHLIVESLKHLVEVYDVDGFRFDLAELLGVQVLAVIERELKKVKPGIILIAEPWSFRGHIARDLKLTTWAFWNDGFRDFLVDYVRGDGNQEGIRYFMAGSLWHLTSFPAQSVNYVESHDDFCWIDRITEQDNNNGCHPLHNDRARTHIMFAILMSSIGVPMFSAGQDYLRSKQGNHNTYLMGDINALDYNRISDQQDTHDYVKGWIKFRSSQTGRLFRLFEKPGEHFFRFFGADGTSAIATLYNADFSRGSERVIVAINPHMHEVTIGTDDHNSSQWTQIADTWHINEDGVNGDMFRDHQIILPPMSCGLWTEKKKITRHMIERARQIYKRPLAQSPSDEGMASAQVQTEGESSRALSLLERLYRFFK